MRFTRLLASTLLIAFPLCTAAQEATTDVDPPVTEHISANTEIRVTSPTNTWYGTRGLSQTASAEALGQGRFVFGLNGSFYQQQKQFSGSPNKGANLFPAIGSIALGLNRHVDAFASITGFGSTDYTSNHASGPGTVGAGVQGTLPFAQSAPVRMAAQVGLYQGLTDNPIDSNKADGYAYFEARTGLDFMGKLIQTLVFGSEDAGFKMHFNEGVVTSAESGTEPLFLLGAAAQINLFAAVLGAEIHNRSLVSGIEFGTDPLWLTPSLQFRSAYDINLSVGADIALSGERDDGTRALEPYRLFAGMAFTFDTEAGARAAAKAKAQKEAREKAGLMNKNRTLQEQAREDSLASLRQKAASDSAAAAMAAKAQGDSLAMAEKARQDSIALAETKKNLELEKSKRSDAEKQLLSTGLLLMDAVYFETGKTDISINSKPYLNIIAKMLTKYTKLRIEVAGHTDDVGSDVSNQRLSQGRAESVASYMTSVAPELRDILTAKGYGESMPKAENKSAEGRKLNRRTELQVLNKEVLKEYNP